MTQARAAARSSIAIETNGSGEPLVLLHGVGTSRVIWRRAMPFLAARRLVAAADLPGFGESSPVGEGFDLEEVAEALAEALAVRVQAPFDLLGNSLGGAVALTLAHRRPDLVRRLVLAAPAGLVPRHRAIAEGAGVIGETLIGARRLLGPLAGSAPARSALLWGAIGDPGSLPPEDARLMLGASRGAKRIRAAIATVAASDLRPLLEDLRPPLGLVWGDHDRVVPIAGLDEIKALAPAAVAEVIPGAGHVVQIERPREFADAVGSVLSRLRPVTD